MRADEGTMQMAAPRPVEGRSLRSAGDEAKLGPTLSGVDSATLLRALLPRAPIDTVDVSARRAPRWRRRCSTPPTS
jgi:hypothetical protein